MKVPGTKVFIPLKATYIQLFKRNRIKLDDSHGISSHIIFEFHKMCHLLCSWSMAFMEFKNV